MDQLPRRYGRRDNPFPWREDLPQTPARFDQPLPADGPSWLGGLAGALHPAHADRFAGAPVPYYWSVADSAGASDVMVTARAALRQVYPQRLR